MNQEIWLYLFITLPGWLKAERVVKTKELQQILYDEFIRLGDTLNCSIQTEAPKHLVTEDYPKRFLLYTY